ncbi:MAG: ATP-binding protein [Candidatus Muirbacterium halophilum]|nr:ATP-binding protein [Candidatus Muirbacterium halophilum]MCK9476852.1 ATP-binding protein [Candidatus Muirbacterium halophilum]
MKKFPANTNSLKKIREYIELFFKENNILDNLVLDDIKLITVELVTNIIKHSKESKEFSLKLNYEKNNIEIEFEFIDKSFKFPKERFKQKKLAQNGFGMYLIKNISDELMYEFNEKNGVVKVNVTKRIIT